MSYRILILDTPAGDLADLASAFRSSQRQYEVAASTTLSDLLARLETGLPYDLVVLDFLLGDGVQSGCDVLPAIRKRHPLLPIIAAAQQGSVELTAQAIDAGANDFLVRSGQLNERVATLLGKIQGLLSLADRNRRLGEQNMLLQRQQLERYRIIGESPQIMEVLRRIKLVAKIPRPVLIVGERGTGKELVARAIHSAASAKDRPFVVVNCAVATETLLESDLFGHEKGSFTGAQREAYGKFEQADGGTLFLDEIGNMSLGFQQKILRVVEYGTFTRVGGSKEIHSSARIVAATNADLQERMQTGQFLPDLYDRLSFEVIRVPPLRERQGDIELLARHFLAEFMQEIPSLGGKRLGKAAMEMLRQYAFPGNIRELKNFIERSACHDTGEEITPQDLDMPSSLPARAAGHGFDARVEAFKRQLVADALTQNGDSQAKAAASLGLSYDQFRHFFKKYRKC